MKRITRAATNVVSAAAALTLLGACGAPESPNASTDTDGKLEGRGPITFVAGKDTSGSMQKIVDRWNADHPKEKVTFEEPTFDADQFRAKVAQAAQAKSDTFSVISMDVVWTGEFAKRGYVVPLPDDAVDTSEFLSGPVETATYDGKLYGVPWKTDTGILYYRKDLLDKYGLKAPTTWAELAEACEKVAEPEGIDCYAGQHGQTEGLTVNVSEAVNSAGGSLVTDGKPTADTPEAIKGLTFLADAFKKGWAAPEALTYDEEAGRARFQSGELLFQRNWPYMYALANAKGEGNKAAGKFDIAPLPGADGAGSATLGGHNLAISTYAKNKATALDFIKFFTQEDNQKQNLLVGSYAPTRSAVYEDKDVVSEIPYLSTMKTALDKAVPRPAAVPYQQVTAAIQEAGLAVEKGTKTPAEAAKDLQAALVPLLGK
ncbi:ABC transporter substrate-binding protein [Streptomyces sp. NPDC003247]|uniref:ABC transporter substrate-binding protein n=1 Tax=Streptomyces sp. NPDC003247 TaxID=3364677 RepID=UPI00368BDBC0